MIIDKKQNKRGDWIATVSEDTDETFLQDRKYNAEALSLALINVGLQETISANFDPDKKWLSFSFLLTDENQDLARLADLFTDQHADEYNPSTSSDEDAVAENETIQDNDFNARMGRLLVQGLNNNTTFRNAVQRALGITET